MKRFGVVGAGFAGAVAARELATASDCRVEVFDERQHFGGNCHTERDEATGVMVHRYGPHIFHTDRKEVWDYVNRFGEFRPFINRVKAATSRGIFSLPVNLHTINQFFDRTFSPSEARVFLGSITERIDHPPRNFEEQALSMVGRELYETFLRGYTEKQWGCEPADKYESPKVDFSKRIKGGGQIGLANLGSNYSWTPSFKLFGTSIALPLTVNVGGSATIDAAVDWIKDIGKPPDNELSGSGSISITGSLSGNMPVDIPLPAGWKVRATVALKLTLTAAASLNAETGDLQGSVTVAPEASLTGTRISPTGRQSPIGRLKLPAPATTIKLPSPIDVNIKGLID